MFHDVSLGSMLESVRDVRWTWVGVAIAIDILSYVTQGLRWRLLLMPVGELPWIDATRAIYAGLFASEVLPMRPGEVLRAVLVSRRLNAPVSAVVPSILVERLFDGVWLAMGMGIAAILVPLPVGLRRAGDVFGVLILVATAAFLYEALWVRDRHAAEKAGAASEPPGRVERFRRRFREIGRRRETYVAFGLSLLFLVGQATAFWLVAIAYDGLHLGFWASASRSSSSTSARPFRTRRGTSAPTVLRRGRADAARRGQDAGHRLLGGRLHHADSPAMAVGVRGTRPERHDTRGRARPLSRRQA